MRVLAVDFSWAWLGLVPFLAFAAAFLIIPTFYLVTGSFRTESGQPTLQNYADLSQPTIVEAFRASIEISVVTAVVGGIFGFLLAYAVIRGGLPRFLGAALMTFSGVASNFAGVPLALAFTFTLGATGLVTILLMPLGIDLKNGDFTIFSKLGLEIAYLYFQFPLMVLIMAPAIQGLKTEWREASENMGASTYQYWRHIALPILMPTLLGTMILLFGNAFGAQATAYTLTGEINIVTLLVTRQINGDVLNNINLGYAVAMGMVGVMGDHDPGLPVAPAPGGAVAAMRRTRFAWWLIFVIAALYFFVPLVATFIFSLGNPLGNGAPPPSFEAYGTILASPDFWGSLTYSFIAGIVTIIVSIGLLMPTAYWVRLKVPRARPVIEFITLLPFVIPPIILVFGLISTFSQGPVPLTHTDMGSNVLLVAAYTVLSFPYMYRAIDTGLQATDIRSLTEAAQSLGAGWTRIILAGDPAEPAGGPAERRVPDPGHRGRRVHHRLVPGAARLRPVPAAARPERGLRTGRGHDHQLRIDLAGDDHDRLHRPWRADPRGRHRRSLGGRQTRWHS